MKVASYGGGATAVVTDEASDVTADHATLGGAACGEEGGGCEIVGKLLEDRREGEVVTQRASLGQTRGNGARPWHLRELAQQALHAWRGNEQRSAAHRLKEELYAALYEMVL